MNQWLIEDFEYLFGFECTGWTSWDNSGCIDTGFRGTSCKRFRRIWQFRNRLVNPVINFLYRREEMGRRRRIKRCFLICKSYSFEKQNQGWRLNVSNMTKENLWNFMKIWVTKITETWKVKKKTFCYSNSVNLLFNKINYWLPQSMKWTLN